MRVRKVILISPPFSSHLNPMIALARAFTAEGVQASVACSEQFKGEIVSREIGFIPLVINPNANTGIALSTQQPDEERRRLAAFLESTFRGAIETLKLQSRDRRADMLPDPQALRIDIQAIEKSAKPDLWVANQLSYSVTLALYCLGFPFVTFCLPHPGTIPDGKKIFGVPSAWPKAFRVDPAVLCELEALAREVEKEFTSEFNANINTCDRKPAPIPNAFRLTSTEAILYNYPDFWNVEQEGSKPRKIYMGYCFDEQSLPSKWKKMLHRAQNRYPKILMVMGTFLSYRSDVLERCISVAREQFPECFMVVAAGTSTDELKRLQQDSIAIEEWVPQRGLLPYMDIVIHHGGSNSFTETLYFGKPMVIFPFSSDQFDIASDAEHRGIGEALDPNSFSPQELKRHLRHALARSGDKTLISWRDKVTKLGPRYAVRKLLFSR